MKRAWIFAFLLISLSGSIFAQISCGFIVDLSAPSIDSIYPAPDSVVSSTYVNFGVVASDDGAGIWYDNTTSQGMWDTSGMGCDLPVATYITYSVNGGAFTDTMFNMLSTTQSFGSGDTVRACVHIIDHIENLGCSCCPNDTDTCWTFYIFACDSFQLAELCPSPCEVVTSCTTQTFTFLIDSIGSPTGGPDSGAISVEVYVNGTPYTGTIGSEDWAEYHGNPDDGIYPDTIVINPPMGYWNHHDSVVVVIGDSICPVVLPDTCSFVVDLVPPELSAFSPADGETLTSAVVNITGSLTDDFIGIAPGSTWVSITTYDTVGGIDYDTIYSLSDMFNINRTFESGDSIVVCVHSADDVDLQPGCLCPPNDLDSSWWFTVLISEPYGWIVIPFDSNGNGTIVSDCFSATDSSCGNQQIILRVYDSHGMTDTGIVLNVNGTIYDETSPAISTTILGTDTLEITFDPAAIGTCWTDGEWVHFELDSAFNTLGFTIISPVIDSFIVDLSPPTFSGILPVDGSVLNSTDVTISVNTTDSICGAAIFTNIHASGIAGGVAMDSDLAVDSTDSFGYDFTGLQNGDSVMVCAYAQDTCADYCGPNIDSTCWTFTIVIGTVSASVVAPVDTNGDGWVISNCADQQIIWTLNYDDAIGIDWSRLWVNVDGTDYNWGDSHLDTLNSHTLIFTPSPDWGDHDSIVFCLDSLFDTTGAVLDEPACGWVLIDLQPPVLVASTPNDGDTIYVHDISVNATFYDSICTDTLTSVDSCWAEEWNGGTLTNTFEGYSFPLNLTGLSDGDSIGVCAIVSDGCRDYCDFNTDTICWYFLIMMGEPWGEFIAPPDTNLDGERITTCADGGFILYVHDSHGMDTTYFHFTVDTNGTGPMDYHYGDPEVSVSYITDSTTMEILFNPSWTLSSGSWVYVTLDTAINILATPDSLVTPVIDSFLIDTEAPTFTYTGPTGTIGVLETTIAVGASDAICGSNVAYDSLVITSSLSGIDWHITTGVWDTTISGMLSGDSVSICAYAHDICSDTCGPNYGYNCWYFLVETGITITLLEPIDVNGDGDTISACADQQIIWDVTTTSGVGFDPTTISIDVCGDTYTFDSTEVSISGDSIIWTPPSGFWTDGEHCDFSLAICDSGGVCDTSYGQVLIDLAPPVFAGEYPLDGSTILVDNTDIYITASDAVCIDAVPEFIHITSSVSGIDTTISDTLAAHISGLVDGDNVTVCVAAHDTCADYFCSTANHDTTCWTFDVALGAVRASVLEPRDVNGDLCINTACNCQPILWQVISQHGVDTSTFQAVIDGITYTWGPEFTLTLTPAPGDTIYTIEFDPAVAGTCWTENGYVIDYAITYLADTLGTDSLAADVGGSFTELLVPPDISLTPLPEDTAVCLDSVNFTAFISDTVACTYEGTLSVNLTGTSPDSSFTIPLSDIATDISVPVLSGDTLCVHISTFNIADYSDSCSFTDTLYSWTNSLDTCYEIHCLCDISVYAGPDQYSCPGADVILGCDPVYTGTGFTSAGVNWYDDGDTIFSTDENPTVNPINTMTYMVEAWAICVDGDTVWAYDTMTVYIDYEPVVPPTIVSPSDGEELTEGTHTLVWNALDTSTITTPIYYYVLESDTLFSPSDSMTDTTLDFDISCEETLTFAVVSFNSCFYSLDDSCNPADSISAYTSATYETSAVITVWGEPCGQPQAQAVFPPPNTISGCDTQLVIFEVWDGAGVGLVPESLRVQIGSNIYDTSESFITYTYIRDDSGVVTVAPPEGVWNDNDTITVRIIELYNVFDQPLPGPASLTFYTDFTPPVANMSYPTPDTIVSEHSPTVVLNVTDAVCGVVEDSFIVWIHNSRINDSLIYPSSSELSWDPSNDNLSISFEDLGITLAEGETISIDLHTCDCVDSAFCGPNCADYNWSFWYPYEVGCSRVPNPFTPNDDMKNEYAQFTFPDMAAKDGTIYIYDIYSSLVKQIDVPAGQGVAETKRIARWDGTDSNGNKVSQGLYLYVIVVDGEVVCEGTVTVAR